MNPFFSTGGKYADPFHNYQLPGMIGKLFLETFTIHALGSYSHPPSHIHPHQRFHSSQPTQQQQQQQQNIQLSSAECVIVAQLAFTCDTAIPTSCQISTVVHCPSLGISPLKESVNMPVKNITVNQNHPPNNNQFKITVGSTTDQSDSFQLEITETGHLNLDLQIGNVSMQLLASLGQFYPFNPSLPTGAGETIRFPDGTGICWNLGCTLYGLNANIKLARAQTQLILQIKGGGHVIKWTQKTLIKSACKNSHLVYAQFGNELSVSFIQVNLTQSPGTSTFMATIPSQYYYSSILTDGDGGIIAVLDRSNSQNQSRSILFDVDRMYHDAWRVEWTGVASDGSDISIDLILKHDRLPFGKYEVADNVPLLFRMFMPFRPVVTMWTARADVIVRHKGQRVIHRGIAYLESIDV